jgi:uncharacterized protein (DUF433 family)
LISNGERTVAAEGETSSEAWYRAARKALEEKPMLPPLAPISVPLRVDQKDTLRVGDSRITLDILINEYNQGSDPESIVLAYPTLRRADVYMVIGWYLLHEAEVRDYLARRDQEAEALRSEIESQQTTSNAELRAILLARRAQQEQEQDHASTGR